MAHTLSIGFILQNPSPHQVELLNSIATRPDTNITIGYLHNRNQDRNWGNPKPHAPTAILPGHRRLSHWIDQQNVDIWVLGSIYTSLATHIAARQLAKQSRPFVYLAEPPRPSGRFRHAIQKLLVSHIMGLAAGFASTGKEAVHRYQSVFGATKPAISAPYVISLVPMLNISKTTTASGPVKFLTMAQLVERKGIDVLIDACRYLPPTGWQLDVYGDGALEQKLVAQAATVSDRIRFHPAIAFHDRIDALGSADVFVLPTRWDGWGMVIPEALAAGLPVIATARAMSAHEFITSGENGFIVEHESPAAIATAMMAYLDGNANAALQAAAARHAVSKYTPDLIAAQLVTFLNSLVCR